MSSTIDQADDGEIEPLGPSLVRDILDDYTRANDGVEPKPDEECDGNQLSVLKDKLDAGVCPYADFSVFRPFGSGFARAMKFMTKVWNPEAMTYATKELPGPPDVQEWLRCWKCYSFGMRALKAASAQRLGRYADKVIELADKYKDIPGGGWWFVYLADVRMRSEWM